MLGNALTPPIDEIWMIWPEPCARMMRHGRLRHPQRAEQVCFDLGARFVFTHFLDRAEQSVAGIVDDDIKPAEAAMRIRDGGIDGGLVVDVEPDRGNAVAVFLDEVRERGDVAGRRGDPVAARQRRLGPDAAKAL